jgi:hypothetical protein|tara:strand:- start:213 stop:392 length:180 start_codon:yes stop_codon:yes gene_type:complete
MTNSSYTLGQVVVVTNWKGQTENATVSGRTIEKTPRYDVTIESGEILKNLEGEQISAIN